MLKKFCVGAACFISVACSSSPVRMPASDNVNLRTRDGKIVATPDLRVSLALPLCPEDKSLRTDKDECLPSGETALFQEITEISFRFQSAQNPPSEKVSQRDFHAKQHACLAGTWTPLKTIPGNMAVGVFALKDSAPVVVRYSNGSPKRRSEDGSIGSPADSQPDARGLAIKLVGLPGDSILEVEDRLGGAMNQDFVLINDPSFFLRSPKSYPNFLTALTEGKPFFQNMDAGELAVLKRTTRTVNDVVTERFFSQTPYVLGDQKAKYSVRQCKQETAKPLTAEESKNPNFLRQRIQARLKKQPICLIFSVQLRTPQMDVEDAAVDWNEKDSAFVDVAKILIPQKQNFNDPERDAYCENISFNPWNSMAENRPAGGINRARLAVYSAISRKRRMENTVQVREPRSSEEFFDVLRRPKNP